MNYYAHSHFANDYIVSWSFCKLVILSAGNCVNPSF
jgi:hypothetical protein